MSDLGQVNHLASNVCACTDRISGSMTDIGVSIGDDNAVWMCNAENVFINIIIIRNYLNVSFLDNILLF